MPSHRATCAPDVRMREIRGAVSSAASSSAGPPAQHVARRSGKRRRQLHENELAVRRHPRAHVTAEVERGVVVVRDRQQVRREDEHALDRVEGEDEDDAHYLIRWADSFRETKLSETETVRGSGRVVLFADMLRAVLSDVPRTTALSLALTVAMVVAAAGFTWEAFAVLGSLLVGI